jgi:putative endonuclease
MSGRQFYVYILANKPFGTLYIGVTNDLLRRVFEHKQGAVEGFTAKYRLHDLVYYEVHETIEAAIMREKLLKRWRRDWKIDLISAANPEWGDLYSGIAQ